MIFMRIFFSRTLLLPVFSHLSSASGQHCLGPKTAGHDTSACRFPTTNDREIVFCYAGELYAVGKDGGVARRLTSGPGYSSFPHFSPTAHSSHLPRNMTENTEVYAMPGEGGVPKRLTTSATLGRDDISDRMGPKQHRHDVGEHETADCFSLAHEVIQRFYRPAFHRGNGCGASAATARAARRLRLVLAR